MIKAYNPDGEFIAARTVTDTKRQEEFKTEILAQQHKGQKITFVTQHNTVLNGKFARVTQTQTETAGARE